MSLCNRKVAIYVGHYSFYNLHFCLFPNCYFHNSIKTTTKYNSGSTHKNIDQMKEFLSHNNFDDLGNFDFLKENINNNDNYMSTALYCAQSIEPIS